MKEMRLPDSQLRSWYARRSASVTMVFLKKSTNSGISPSSILRTPRVGEDEVAIVTLFIAELYPESSSLIDGALEEVGWGTEVLAMERKGKGNSKIEVEYARAKVMGSEAHSSAQSYRCSKRRRGDSFPEKKGYLSVSTARGIRKRDRGAEQFGSLKYFEIHSVRGKEPCFDKRLL
jgi:hypothetical protein